MTTSRIGIMGSFLVSNFSRWVTNNRLVVQRAATTLRKRRANFLAPDGAPVAPSPPTSVKDNMRNKRTEANKILCCQWLRGHCLRAEARLCGDQELQEQLSSWMPVWMGGCIPRRSQKVRT